MYPATGEMQSVATAYYNQPSPAARMLAPQLGTIAICGLAGLILGFWFGLIVGVVIGLILVVVARAAAGLYSLDLHDAEMLDRTRAPESYKFTEELAAELGIEPPVIYRINIDQPQICVCATGTGKRVRGRIGISRGLFEYIHNDQLHTLLAVAMARIWSGEATLMSMATALAGLPMQLAQADGLNRSLGTLRRDPECGLSPLGKMLLIILTPFARMILALSAITKSVYASDKASLKIGRRVFEPIRIEAALRWLHNQQPPPLDDPLSVFNPSEAAVYLVSPFEIDYSGAQPEGEQPLWKRSRFLVTSMIPSLEARVQRLNELNGGKSGLTESTVI